MIKLESIVFGYSEKFILEDLSLRIESGEFTALLGPNGAGKSTLMRLMAGLLQPLSGNIFLEEKNIAKISRKEFAKMVAFLPSVIQCPYHFSVEEIVRMGRAPHLSFAKSLTAQDEASVQKALRLTGAIDWVKRSIHSLSSGQQQIVFLAQALAQEASVLLLDEPTLHLDIHHQLHFCKLLKQWNKETGSTIAAVFHDLNLAAQFCSRFVLMSEGKIVAAGASENVLSADQIETVYKIKTQQGKHPTAENAVLFFE